MYKSHFCNLTALLIYICTHTNTQTHMNACTHTCAGTHTDTHAQAHTHTHTHAQVYTHTHTPHTTHTHTHIHIHIHTVYMPQPFEGKTRTLLKYNCSNEAHSPLGVSAGLWT